MNVCVNKSSREFKALQKKLNLSSATLANAIHTIWYETGDIEKFPTEEDIKRLLSPTPIRGDSNTIKVWKDRYSQPLNFPTREMAATSFAEAIQIFGKGSVRLIERMDGSVDVMVGSPQSKGMSSTENDDIDAFRGNNNQNDTLKALDEAIKTGNWTDEALDKLENLTLEDYDKILKRFSQEELRAGNGILTQAASILTRGDGRTDQKNTSADSPGRAKQQEQQIESWAKEAGLWYSDYQESKDGSLEGVIEADGGKLSDESGSEAMVFFTENSDKDGVIKAIDASHYTDSLQSLLDKIILHNSLFPETSYEVTGFGRDRGGTFRVIAKQKFIGGKKASVEDINKLIKQLNLEKKGGWYYTKDGKRISDLSPKNVLKTTNGGIAVIDCDVEFTREYLKDAANATYTTQQKQVQDISTISNNSASFGVKIDANLKRNWQSWQQSNPDGIVAYRVNYNRYNTPEEAEAGRIGNPFSEGGLGINKGEDTVQKFYDWLITGNNFGEPKATEEYRQAIIDKILSTPRNSPILYYKELGRPSHATIIGYLINHKDILNSQQQSNSEDELDKLTEGTAEETSATTENSKEDKEIARLIKRQKEINRQMNELLTGGKFKDQVPKKFRDDIRIPSAELRKIANGLAYVVSEHITNIQEKGIDWVENEYQKKFRDEEDNPLNFASMERIDVINAIGVDNLFEHIRQQYSPQHGVQFKSIHARFRWQRVVDNWDAMILLMQPKLLQLEGLSMRRTVDEGIKPIGENTSNVQDDSDYSNDSSNIQELEVSELEHWQVETRCLDLLENMTDTIRRVLSSCKIKTIVDGQVKQVYTDIGLEERVDDRTAVNTILNWCWGSSTLSEMVVKLQDKMQQSETNLWIGEIVDKLTDTSGRNTDFQSQFFSTFCKDKQLYGTAFKKNGKWITTLSNRQTALRQAFKGVLTSYKIGNHPMFLSSGKVNKRMLATFSQAFEMLPTPIDIKNWRNKEFKGKNNIEDPSKVASILSDITKFLGVNIDASLINSVLNNDTYYNMYNSLEKIRERLEKHQDDKNWRPFVYGATDALYVETLQYMSEVTAPLEDNIINGFYENGKMYQSWVLPSQLTKLMRKMKVALRNGDAAWKAFIDEQYNSPFFYGTHTVNNGKVTVRDYYPSWLKYANSTAEFNGLLDHKVQLSFNKSQYMKNLSPEGYILSALTEYFSERTYKNYDITWFRVPMQSDKPSADYIKFHTRKWNNLSQKERAKELLTEDLRDIFLQELSRIQTVKKRNKQEGDPEYIDNFDEYGRKFCFLDFMNDYLDGEFKDSELGQIINDKINGREVDEKALNELSYNAIYNSMDAKVYNQLKEWKSSGILKAASKIENVLGGNNFGSNKIEEAERSEAIKRGENPDQEIDLDTEVEDKELSYAEEQAVMEKLEEFLWNDTVASINILELTVGDIAFYGTAENLQKRLAQIHAPAKRPNIEATDYGITEGKNKRRPQRVSDGYERSVTLADYDNFQSNIIDNLEIFFDRKIKESNGTEKIFYETLKEDLIGKNGAYREINVADAQAFNSPTSYRKKALLFGAWSTEAEAIYQKIRNNQYNYSDLKTAFQPLKPVVSSHVEKPAGVDNVPMNSLHLPVFHKNSEYLIMMSEALLHNENTGKPNLLRALYEVMEESHYNTDGTYRTDGIDTIQFESAVKSGGMAKINIAKYAEDPNGELKAKELLQDLIYEKETIRGQKVNQETGETTETTADLSTDQYNITYVHKLPYEDYGLQQEIPEHYKDHFQQEGSQARAIIPAELPSVDASGNTIYYNVQGKQLTAEEFRKEYEKTHKENIEQDLKDLEEELHLKAEDKKERNTILSKVLQREILSSTRYGIDLFLACSVDENGDFRIPLNDPIQYKRIEQLLNSIVKNRVMKQKIAGGPLVQVSNFGASKQLNIRFKDKEGNLLKTRAEFNGSDAEFKQYLKENQGSIAYFEVLAPLHTNSIFSRFADRNGTIDIKAIEEVDPDLLKLIGYRIPTEAKYSMMPMKIVGFLPREAGDGIMMPADITLITGSDFDVDKMYIMRKEIDIKDTEIKEGEKLSDILYKTADLKVNLTESGLSKAREKADQIIQRRLSAAKNSRDKALKVLEERDETAEDIISDKEYVTDKQQEKSWEQKDKDTWLKKQTQKIEDKYQEKVKEINASRKKVESEVQEGMIEQAKKDRIKEFLQDEVSQNSKMDNASAAALRKAYLKYKYQTVHPKEGRSARNNKILDMMYEVLTHESSMAEMFNPGGFEQQKRMGYMIQAYKTSDKSWKELSGMSTKELKSLASTKKNLIYFGDNAQFYKQNAAAGSLIGIFAVNRVAHSFLVDDRYQLDVDGTIGEDSSFMIDGMLFKGRMDIDSTVDRLGNSITKIFASLVASSVDAVKDPVLNLMNINQNTVNVLNTLVKLGMDFETSALFLSQPIINRAIEENALKNVEGSETLQKTVQSLKKTLSKGLEVNDSKLYTEDISKESLIENLRGEGSLEHSLKVLNAMDKLLSLSEALRITVAATRVNSVVAAPGPLAINTIRLNEINDGLSRNSKIIDPNIEESMDDGATFYNPTVTIVDIWNKHPMLGAFAKSYDIANEILKHSTAYNQTFQKILAIISNKKGGLGNIIIKDKTILNKFLDFYTSYALLEGGVVNSNHLKKMIGEFPTYFIREKFKEKYPNNPFIQALNVETDKAGRPTLKLSTTNLETAQKEMLSAGWADIEAENPQLSHMLFEYCFFKGGVGYSPKSFMNLCPIEVKEGMPKYLDTLRVMPTALPKYIINQFIRNNTDNYKLVPRRTLTEKDANGEEIYISGIRKEGKRIVIEGRDVLNDFGRLAYFKVKDKSGYKIYRQVDYLEATGFRPEAYFYEETTALGGNNDYLEISTDDIKTPTKIDVIKVNTVEEDPNDIQSETNDEVEPDFDEQAESVSEELEKSTEEQIDIAAAVAESLIKDEDFTSTQSFSAWVKGNERRGISKKSTISSVGKLIAKHLKEKRNIEVSESKVNEELDKLC